MNISVILPSLDPDEKLLGVIRGLKEVGLSDIILVNDGSDAAHQAPFREAEALGGVTVLTHEVNRGKGRALKTAFAYCLENRPDIDGVVTVDGDGQHTAKDIYACAKRMAELGDEVVLGVRDFTQPQVPRRNRFGNRFTSGVFRFACGIRISDTQTGLRAIPRRHLAAMLEIEGERFEYETEMLLQMKRRDIRFTEVTIDTVYIGENETSHFKVFRDSFRIYRMIFRYALSSLASAAVDYLLYSAILLLLGERTEQGTRLAVAFVGARLASSFVNYSLNRRAVFHSKGKGTLGRYYALCVTQLGVSYGLVYLLSHLSGGALAGDILWKLPVDIVLFIASFQIQQRWVFKT